MKLVNISKIAICLTSLLLLILPFSNPKIKADSEVIVNDLLSVDMQTWFNTNATSALDVETGGVYVIKPIGDELFLGFNKSFPSEDAGNTGDVPVLASHDGTNLTKIADLYEDALYRMKTSGNKLYIPSYDPSPPYGWDAGNLYIYDTSTDELEMKRYRYDDWHYIDYRTTDSNGIYSFENLKATSYLVRVINPTNYAFTDKEGTPDDNEDFEYFLTDDFDSNFDEPYGGSITCYNNNDIGINFMDPQMDDTVDAGLVSTSGYSTIFPPNNSDPVDTSFYSGTYGISGRVWEDEDPDNNPATNTPNFQPDGIQDDGEQSMAGIRVELYTKDPYFPCAIHMPAMTIRDDGMYVNYGHVRPSLFLGEKTSTNANAVWRSIDEGETWEILSDDIDYYFMYDIEDLNGWLYKVMYGRNERNIPVRHYKYLTPIQYSTNGVSWGTFVSTTATPTTIADIRAPNNFNMYDIYGHQIPFSGELISFKDKFIFMDITGTKLHRFYDAGIHDEFNIEGADFTGILEGYNDPDQNFDTKVTDAQAGMMHNWNTFANVNDEYFYGIGKDNKIYVTTDLRKWTTVADFSQVDEGAPLITLAYWPNKNWLVAATAGENGSVYYIDLDQIESEVITKINNNQGLSFFNDYENVDLKNIGGTGEIDITIKKDNIILSKSSVDLGNTGGAYNWNNVKGGVDTTKGRSFVYGLTDSIGSANTHNLYIPIANGETSEILIICPNASTLNEVRSDCVGKIEFEENETKDVNGVSVTVTKITIDSVNYWVASGVNGTGGIAYYEGYTDPIIPIEEEITQNNNSSVSIGASQTTKTTLVSEIVSYPVSYLTSRPNSPINNSDDKEESLSEIPLSTNPVQLVLICLGLLLATGVAVLFVTKKKT
jgi:hypothetical protein